MGIFSAIKDAIFGKTKKPATHTGMPQETVVVPASPSATVPVETASVGTMEAVDVEAVMEQAARDYGQPSNWRTSIVDLLKLLGLDSSLAARKELAAELGHSGPYTGTAEQNVWLHRQVMKKLAENGGRVPAELKN